MFDKSSWYEAQYLQIAQDIEAAGHESQGRNGVTLSLPFQTIDIDMSTGKLPLLTTRKMYTAGILGEYAATIRGPKHIDDYKRWGCNYWDTWADSTGNLTVDYGNAWRDYNGVNQVQTVLDKLKTDPRDRRLLITAWRPDRLANLSLPCCHYAYQFYSTGTELSLLWHQRSADWMVGVPSDAVFAAVMLACFADLAGQKPGKIKMVFGDAHVYKHHTSQLLEQCKRTPTALPSYKLNKQQDLYSFEPKDLLIGDYESQPAIAYELFA